MFKVFKIVKDVEKPHLAKLVASTLDRKPSINAVCWFSVSNGELVPHIANNAEYLQLTAGSQKFRDTQRKLFNEYFELTS
jgi:hypothetical protein